MSIHIVVDGYNVIRSSPWLRKLEQSNLQLGRDTLISTLADYKKLKGHSITVVFDGIDIPQIYRQRDIEKGIEIKFSMSNETADQVINKIVIKEREKALVVSSDRQIIAFAESYGASVINSTTFEKKVISIDFSENEDNAMVGNYSKKSKLITRKKGPKKKLPKNRRKHQLRIKKL